MRPHAMRSRTSVGARQCRVKLAGIHGASVIHSTRHGARLTSLIYITWTTQWKLPVRLYFFKAQTSTTSTLANIKKAQSRSVALACFHPPSCTYSVCKFLCLAFEPAESLDFLLDGTQTLWMHLLSSISSALPPRRSLTMSEYRNHGVRKE
jgi:hypothetical protein